MRLTFTDTSAGCTMTGTALNSTWAAEIPLSTAATKALIANLVADPVKPYVEAAGVVIKRTDTGVTLQTATGIFVLHWSILVTIPGLFA